MTRKVSLITINAMSIVRSWTQANAQRTAFHFSRHGHLALDGELTEEGLVDELLICAKEQLCGDLEKVTRVSNGRLRTL